MSDTAPQHYSAHLFPESENAVETRQLSEIIDDVSYVVLSRRDNYICKYETSKTKQCKTAHNVCVCVCVSAEVANHPTIRPSDPPTIRVSYAFFFLRSLKTGPWTQFVFSTFSRPDFIRPVCLLSGLFRCVFMTLIKPILFTLTAGTVLETFFLTDRSLIAEILQTHSRFN